jgi:hypothetical protein
VENKVDLKSKHRKRKEMIKKENEDKKIINKWKREMVRILPSHNKIRKMRTYKTDSTDTFLDNLQKLGISFNSRRIIANNLS